MFPYCPLYIHPSIYPSVHPPIYPSNHESNHLAKLFESNADITLFQAQIPQHVILQLPTEPRSTVVLKIIVILYYNMFSSSYSHSPTCLQNIYFLGQFLNQVTIKIHTQLFGYCVSSSLTQNFTTLAIRCYPHGNDYFNKFEELPIRMFYILDFCWYLCEVF